MLRLKINPKNQEAVERKQRLQRSNRKPPPSANATPVAAPPKKKTVKVDFEVEAVQDLLPF